MNAKKLIALLLALVLCVSVLAACNTQPQETTQATTKATEGTTAATTEATTQATEPAPLTNAERYPIDFDGTLTAATKKDVNEKMVNWLRWEEWTGVDVEWTQVSAEQTPLLFLDEKNLPDIIFQADGLSINQIKEYGQAGLLIDYMEYLDKMPNLSARYAENPGLFDAVLDAEGAAYTLPYYCNTLTMCSNQFFIRTDMTKEAGIEELPTTIEGFLEMCETLQTYYKDTKDIDYHPMVANSGKYMQYNQPYALFFFPAFGELMQTGLTTNEDFTEVTVGFATEQYKLYLDFMHTLYAEGYMDDECYTAEAATTKARIVDKTATMHANPSLTAANFESGELDYQLYPVMTSQYQSEARWALPKTNRSATYMITKNCKDIDAALAFMDALYAVESDPLNEDGTVFGISLWLGEVGVDFTVDKEAGSYSMLPHEGFDTGSQWLSSAGSNSAAYLEWPYFANDGSTGEVRGKGTLNLMRPYGVEVFYVENLILSQEEQDTYNDCWVDIETKVHEMSAAFITGQADLEKDWDTFVDDLYNMGLQDVIDAYQAALDRYNSK